MWWSWKDRTGTGGLLEAWAGDADYHVLDFDGTEWYLDSAPGLIGDVE